MNTHIAQGDSVRIRDGRHAGETATVTKVTWHSNRFGAYARVEVSFAGGETDTRGLDALEKVMKPPRLAGDGH